MISPSTRFVFRFTSHGLCYGSTAEITLRQPDCWSYPDCLMTTISLCKLHGVVPLVIQSSVLSFTRNSGQCNMTDYEHPSWRPLAISEVDKVIFTVCRESKKYDKNNSDRLARAIHLKPQNLSYPNSWLVVMEVLGVFVCLCGSWRFLVVLYEFCGYLGVLGGSWWVFMIFSGSW